MLKKAMVPVILLVGIFIAAQPGMTLSGKHIVELKKAGVSDKTIQIIVEEKAIETAVFSVDDIVNIKKAGVSEETLRMLIKEGSFLKKSEPIIYGARTKSLRFTSAQDVIELKHAGLSDEVIQAIIAVSGERYYSQREEAFDLLRNMGIVVDARGDRRDRREDH
ncbi:MAG: hypothetical protein JSW26_12395 [Desulfobacterales bacterium]|nr:MAG: hypothetical protein JSW26_12395 [Desulfobacterales bacterium]